MQLNAAPSYEPNSHLVPPQGKPRNITNTSKPVKDCSPRIFWRTADAPPIRLLSQFSAQKFEPLAIVGLGETKKTGPSCRGQNKTFVSLQPISIISANRPTTSGENPGNFKNFSAPPRLRCARSPNDLCPVSRPSHTAREN
jgi:hypothetical protein